MFGIILILLNRIMPDDPDDNISRVVRPILLDFYLTARAVARANATDSEYPEYNPVTGLLLPYQGRFVYPPLV